MGTAIFSSRLSAGGCCANSPAYPDRIAYCNAMDPRTRENWAKVKDALERAGKTDCYYYQRAVAILKGGHDPGPPSLFNDK